MILEEHSNQPWYVPLFSRGLTSDTMILTILRLEAPDTRPGVVKMRSKVYVCIPPPPISDKALLATSSVMFRERPQSKHPTANTEYAKASKFTTKDIA